MIDNSRVYYFDTNALIKFYLDEKESVAVRRFVAASPKPVLISRLTMTEFISRLAAAYREKENKLKKRDVNRLLDRLKKDAHTAADSHFQIAVMPDGVFHAAEAILRQYAFEAKISIGSFDALHVAIVKKLSAPPVMVTWDKPMQQVCEKLGIELYNPS